MTEGSREALQEATWTLFNLCINLGIIDSVIGQYPEQVQEGFIEKLKIIERWAGEQIEEVQAFGEAFDDETEEGEGA
jgi:hypothetical protein